MCKVKATLVLLVSILFDLGYEVRKIHFRKGFLKKLLFRSFEHVGRLIPQETRTVDVATHIWCIGLHSTYKGLLRGKYDVL